MKVEGQISSYNQGARQVTNPQNGSGAANGSKRADGVMTPQSSESTSVSISGKALLLSRLFLTEDITSEPSVLPGTKGMNEYGMMLPHHFLTQDDRTLLADMYEFAQEQGADLKHVDRLAWDMGLYRQRNNGEAVANFNDGRSYDLEGRVRTASFTDADATTVERIQSSGDISSTRLDQGFLNYILDPGYGFTHSSDFEFLEQMVSRFSTNGNDTTPLDSKFSTFVYKANNYIIHTSDEPAAEFVRNTSNIEEDTSREALMADAKALPQRINQSLLEAFMGKNDEKATERSFITKLFDWLKPSANK
ncbi:hypothetical protein J7J47_22060 [Halomonas sp. ISL-60]|uniref:hypothetical protein n=1 Tax=Halomonas sp. ISL-56 TaxID=2819149 RepID=UPI001BE6556F|nr:hypothetical protein [Halomonas sp. ISL-56]MBT2774913.1 hypothetical protein [Halomonas sp. ISL-60]MBT2800141.1 hypothetical protein [Halomonas sp. ISL-56]